MPEVRDEEIDICSHPHPLHTQRDTGIRSLESADSIVIPGTILDWPIRQVICVSLKGSYAHQEPEQGHLAICLCVWVKPVVD